jgi:hypothetical protein
MALDGSLKAISTAKLKNKRTAKCHNIDYDNVKRARDDGHEEQSPFDSAQCLTAILK